ncbi:lymphocyte antigen 6K [Apodemus sylvaticus]|uniref:lymphocyte antigen 6K n=1 Tax=Apodemus sylvaticus TaxID=10129 RepID=UPI002244CC48|nr:lymphocyte antigen 6K [Apodemus sylvaticus]
MVILVALLIVLALPLVQSKYCVRDSEENIDCHMCEMENSFDCSNSTQCPPEKGFCLIAVARVFERFFYVSKQCTRVCSTPEILFPSSNPQVSEPKEFLLEKPTPFLYLRCCKWDLCNDKGPPAALSFKEQSGKASERSHRYTGLLLPGFVVLTASGLSALSLL